MRATLPVGVRILKNIFNYLAALGIYNHVTGIMSLFAGAGFFAATLSAPVAHTQARLVLAAETVRPGDAIMAGVHLHMDPRWHTYWKNPGQSGQATTIEWRLPAGITAGEIQWPVPEKLPDNEVTTYIYEKDVVLLVPLKIASDLKAGPLELKAEVKWLECEVKCVQQGATVQASIVVAAETKASKESALLAEWQKKLPKSSQDLSPRAWWEKAGTGDLRPLILEWTASKQSGEADFFPEGSEQFEVQPMTVRLASDTGKIRLRAQVKKFQGDWPKQISGLLIEQSGNERSGYEASLPVATSGGSGSLAGSSPPSVWQMLLYAFIGGLILNVMPCVLPVIALKILGFVSQARDEPRRVRVLGLIYAVGVLVSFLALALLVVGLKAAGSQAGWGFQFGNPYFILAMTVLVTLVALNLFGTFEITPSGRAFDAAATLSSKQGATGAFFNGLLATLLATSCSAPFLGAAVGFAFSQSALVSVLIMLTVGLGLAAPYIVLSWHPAWLKFLPKPGQWMERFKIAMGFPMTAAGVWLCSLLTAHYGERAWWMAIFLVFLAVAAWVYGEFVQRGRRYRFPAFLFAICLLAVGYLYALEGQLHWREPLKEGAISTASKEAPRGIAWEKWSTGALAQARAQGRPVLVDFTAKWCPTCNTVVKPSLESEAVRKKIKQTNTVALLANYTRLPADITAELKRFNRAAVPLVLVYPRNPELEPKVFDLVTPGVVLDALDWAAK